MPHTRAMLEQMLPAAERSVASGAELIRAQQARVAGLEPGRGLRGESEKVLATMEVTQALQVQYVALLRRELAASDS